MPVTAWWLAVSVPTWLIAAISPGVGVVALIGVAAAMLAAR